MSWLLVEDESPKRDAILAFMGEAFPEIEVMIAKSVRSANEQIIKRKPTLLLLDMSLPTFEIAPNEPGGRPQGFGGIEVIRLMDKEEIVIPIIVITAYEAFAKKDGQPIGFESLRDKLAQDFPALFSGLVFFDPIAGRWSDELRILISRIMESE